jgi:hypothetical protein
MRIENVDNQQRQRIPREPNPNATILEEPYNEKMVDKEDDYVQEEYFESV